MQRDSTTPGSAGVAVAGGVGGGIPIDVVSDATSTTTAATSTTVPSVVLVTEPPATQVANSTIPASRRLTGKATYKRYTGYGIPNPCLAPRAPVNTTITVRSLNTGREITCRNVVTYTELPDADLVVVINTETFLDMADTVEAPAPVEISW